MDWMPRLREATGRFAELVDGADPDAPVAGCPGWSVRDLTDHLGGIHQWAAHAVVAGSPDLQPAPMPPAALPAEWYAGHAAALVEVLAVTDPDAPAWTFGPHPRTAAFWRRRQAHETLVHTWDLATAIGGELPQPALDPAVALDGVDEVVTVFFPRQVRLGRTPALETSLGLRPADAPEHPGWLVTGDGTGDPLGAERADVVVTAPADVLLLLLWHRVSPADAPASVSGDPGLAAELLSRPLAP